MKHLHSSFPWLLLLGIALRCVALHQPLIDAHNTRQCQIAILTKNMMAEPGLPLAARADYRGARTDPQAVSRKLVREPSASSACGWV